MRGLAAVLAGVGLLLVLYLTENPVHSNFVAWSTWQAVMAYLPYTLITVGMAEIVRSSRAAGQRIGTRAQNISIPSLDLEVSRPWILTAGMLLAVIVMTVTYGSIATGAVPFNGVFFQDDVNTFDWWSTGLVPWSKEAGFKVGMAWWLISVTLVFFSFPRHARETDIPAGSIAFVWMCLGFMLAFFFPLLT